MSNYEGELAAERAYVAMLYERFDEVRAAAEAEVARAVAAPTSGAEDALFQRDALFSAHDDRRQTLDVADDGLCFGRTDGAAGTLHIGRIALSDEAHEPLLTDWRAPIARPFYCATAANPDGVVRRRHLMTRQRQVLALHDDVLDLEAGSGEDPDAALLAAVSAPRGGTMRDIVATIQAEQDGVIRHPWDGALVVEGGPGTGKTAVALHRIAYLLYTHREQLARRGVLLVGPHPRFLGYIGEVLPSLGETAVVFATPGLLFPGVATTAEDEPETKRVKGSLAMLDVLTAAVADRQELPDEPIEVELSDTVVHLDAAIAGEARARARAAGLKHNQARPVFVEEVQRLLAARAAAQVGEGWLDESDAAVSATVEEDLRRELARDESLAAELELLWPDLTPQRFLADLLSDESRVDTAAAALADRALLVREQGDAWTVSDVPLLDEAAELLGPAREADDAERAARLEERTDLEYAAGVLEIMGLDEAEVDDELRAVDVLDRSALAERLAERDTRALAERAVEDREWTYGHVVVDEAQDLSAMDWRVLLRRCPTRSLTVVGDLAQRESRAGARSWAEVLDPYVPGRWAYRELTVNYRTPAEIMAVAARVLALVDPALQAPSSVRDAGERPHVRRVHPDRLAAAVRSAVEELRPKQGTLAVIAPEGLDVGVPALTPRTAKGLEFDVVVVAEPARILAADRGAADLYVALTRATRRLVIVTASPLPDVLDDELDRTG